jgi:hypothetical protein
VIIEDHSTLLFRASSRSGKSACVEVASLPNGGVAVRDSKDRSRGPLTFDSHGWADFVNGVKNGEFDF